MKDKDPKETEKPEDAPGTTHPNHPNGPRFDPPVTTQDEPINPEPPTDPGGGVTEGPGK